MRAFFKASRWVLVAGLVGGLPGLFPRVGVGERGDTTSALNVGLSVAEAVADDRVVSKPESKSGSLSTWPSLFEEDLARASKSLFAGFPVPKSEAPTEKGLLKANSIAPPILENPAPEKPAKISAQVKKSAPKETKVQIQEKTVAAPSQPVASEAPVQTAQEKAPDLKEIPKETPASKAAVKTETKTEASPPEPAEKKAPALAKTSSPKIPSTKNAGYTIRSENGVLVVYDAEGKVVLRNDSKKKVKIGSESKKEVEPEKKQAFEEETESTDNVPIEPLKFVEVKKGENLSLIASRYPGVTAEGLMKANQIDDPHSIQIGQKIWIPGGFKGVSHRVQEGETISELVSRYNVPSAMRVCDLNGFPRSQNKLEPGSLIVLPGADESAPHEFHSGSKAIRQDLSNLKGKVTWAWPVDGKFMISSPWGLRVDPFSRGKKDLGGEKIRRTMHHGIDMAIPTGTPIYAARAGVVVDAGRKRLHGNSIKVLHDDNWTTIYSHNSKLLVEEGDRVEQGQVIAYSGSTGRSTGPHLHFEIRRPNQESMNPRRLLPPQ